MDELRAAFESRTFDFVDFGAGVGESLVHYERVSGATGAGVELRAAKVRQAQEHGLAVYEGSIFDLPDAVRSTFVTADNVLEHLPNLDQVELALVKAKAIASDFLLVRHPSFDDEAQLAFLGVRPFWCNWRGHSCHIHLSDFAAMAGRIGVSSWSVQPVGRIRSTADPALIPLTAPIDQQFYDPAVHDEKRYFQLLHPVYSAYDILFHFSAEPRVRLLYVQPPEASILKPRLRLGPVTGPGVSDPRARSKVVSAMTAVARSVPGGDAALARTRPLRRRARRALGVGTVRPTTA